MKMRATALFLLAAISAGGCTVSRTSASAPAPQTQSMVAGLPAADVTAPQNEALYLNVIGGLVEQQHYGAALAFLEDYALKHSDPIPRYWMLRGDALLGLGRGGEAALAYGRLDGTELAADGWNGKGQVAAAARRWKDASGNFEHAVHIRPADAQFLNNMAFAEMHLGDGSSAAFHLRQAHELDPESSLIRNNLIIALNMSGDAGGVDQVLAEIKSPDEQNKVRAFVHQTLANNDLTQGKKS